MASGAAMTEKEKMLSGLSYDANNAELWADRVACRRILRRFNHELDYDDEHGRSLLLRQLLCSVDSSDPPFIEPPFYCDYGYNISVGKNFYTNFNCTMLDCGLVKIGDRVLFGPNVQLYTVNHDLDPVVRNGTRGPESTAGITIEDDVWVGGGAIITAGVTIKKGSTVAAGAVVTKDVEPYTVVGGNTAKVLRRLPRPSGEEGGASLSDKAE